MMMVTITQFGADGQDDNDDDNDDDEDDDNDYSVLGRWAGGAITALASVWSL